MIVPMKKVSMVVLDALREESLERLREVGVLHLESAGAKSQTLTDLEEKRTCLKQALRLLPGRSETIDHEKSPPARLCQSGGASKEAAGMPLLHGVSASESPPLEKEDSGGFAGPMGAVPIFLAEKVIELAQRQQAAREETSRLEREAERLSQWGDFDPADVKALRGKGIHIRLYRLTRKQMADIPQATRTFVLKETRSILDIAVVSLADPVEDLPFEEIPLPEQGLSEVRDLLSQKAAEMEEVRRDLSELAGQRESIEEAVRTLHSQIEFETARAGMGLDEKLAFLTGYAPADRVEDIGKAASENGWGLLVEDPGENDPVPTLIENPKWIRIIDPVFKLMDTVPGYKEYDISMWFLLFFSIFFALLIGDGGYGVLFLLLTLTVKRFLPKAPSEPFTLMYILSICTIVWGALTGNWFGCEALAQLPVLKSVVIPALYVHSSGSDFYVRYICFVLAAVHLSIAHLILTVDYINSLRSLAQVGWIIVVWGVFFLIRKLMLDIPMPQIALYMIAAGLGLVLFFASPSRNILKTLGAGLGNILMNGIDVFKDSLSYIRLFAVGMATFALAKIFNDLAANVGFSKVYLAPLSAIIIIVGHAINIALAVMSIAVHGLRLNMLEFSTHVGLEWSGRKYRPFCSRNGFD